MKHTLRKISLVIALGFALLLLVDVIGFALVPGLSPLVLAGGLVVSTLFTIMLGDYSWKPAFRVRRPAPDATAGSAASNPPAGEAGPDWTYTTRVK
jgi:hypothetical protein